MELIINQFNEIIRSEEAVLSLRLIIACIIGALIGIERRKVKGDPAILRMHIFICVGASLVSAVGCWVANNSGGDPARIAAQVIGSIGFLGMGVIFRHGNNISGLTTAASLWITGGLGIAVGMGAYILGVVGAILILATLLIVKDKPTEKNCDENNKGIE
jgi:putative Mg2+ transporter-C (MgtC) family protein